MVLTAGLVVAAAAGPMVAAAARALHHVRRLLRQPPRKPLFSRRATPAPSCVEWTPVFCGPQRLRKSLSAKTQNASGGTCAALDAVLGECVAVEGGQLLGRHAAQRVEPVGVLQGRDETRSEEPTKDAELPGRHFRRRTGRDLRDDVAHDAVLDELRDGVVREGGAQALVLLRAQRRDHQGEGWHPSAAAGLRGVPDRSSVRSSRAPRAPAPLWSTCPTCLCSRRRPRRC